MRFDLQNPCANCPFRSDGAGVPIRRDNIDFLEQHTPVVGFVCHGTIQYDDPEYRLGQARITEHTQQCAGARILLEKAGIEHRRVSEHRRSGERPVAEVNRAAPVFGSFAEMRAAMPEHYGDCVERSVP